MECNCPVLFPGPSLAGCGSSSLFLFMLILEQYLRTQCDIEDPCGQIHPRIDPLPEYDFIVVGAGSAGSVVANRQSEVPEWKVLLIEAGVNESTGSQVPSFTRNAINSSVDWQFVTEPETSAFLNNGGKHSGLGGRYQVIGGTSVLNSMANVRGSRQDYDDWEAMGNRGWSYKDVLLYFIKSENNLQNDSVDPGYHGVGDYLPVSQFSFLFQYEADIIEGAKQMGQRKADVNGKSQLGFTIAQTTSKNAVRFSTARAFLRPVQNRRNLHIMLNTLVTKVLIDPKPNRAFGVEAIKENGTLTRIISLKEVIVCAGAIGSPKILLQSLGDAISLVNIGIPVVLNLPGVGRNLQDHVTYQVKFKSKQTSVQDLNWAEAKKYLRFRNGAMYTTGEAVFGFIQTRYVNPRVNHPDIRLQVDGYQARCSRTGDSCEIKGDIINGTLPTRQFLMRSTLMQPQK